MSKSPEPPANATSGAAAPPTQIPLPVPGLDASRTTPRKGPRFSAGHLKGDSAESLRDFFNFGEAQPHYRLPSQELSAKSESDIPSLHRGSLSALWGPRSPPLWHRHTRMADAGISLFYRWIPCVGLVQPSLTCLNARCS